MLTITQVRGWAPSVGIIVLQLSSPQATDKGAPAAAAEEEELLLQVGPTCLLQLLRFRRLDELDSEICEFYSLYLISLCTFVLYI